MISIKIEYWIEFPHRYTFKCKKLMKFINRYIPHNSKILIPFAGEFRFGTIDGNKYIYNDIRKEINADHHVDAYKLVWFYPKHSFDVIIADPPFSVYKCVQKYGLKKFQPITIFRNAVEYLLKPGGIYIQLGYNSTGLKKNIAESLALGVWNTGQSRNDVLILIQKRFKTIFEFIS